MLLKKLLKPILKPPYRLARFLFRKLSSPPALGYIFMMHRVDDFDGTKLEPNENMKVPPAFLDEQLSALKEKYDIISLSEAAGRIKAAAAGKKFQRKFVVFTMDDGYKDNLTKALPVFKKHDVPFTIFVMTDFPDRKAVLWWYELEELLLRHDSLRIFVRGGDGSLTGRTFSCKTMREKCDAFMEIRSEILRLNQQRLAESLDEMFSDYSVRWNAQCEKLCLSWEDIAELKNEPLVTLAAHTKHHFNLKALESDDAVRAEVQAGLTVLDEKAGIRPAVFAYPFGSRNEVSAREIQALAGMPGFDCACLSYGGACHKKSGLFALPRINFTTEFRAERLRFVVSERIK